MANSVSKNCNRHKLLLFDIAVTQSNIRDGNCVELVDELNDSIDDRLLRKKPIGDLEQRFPLYNYLLLQHGRFPLLYTGDPRSAVWVLAVAGA